MKKLFFIIPLISFFLLGCQKKENNFQAIQNINIQDLAKQAQQKYTEKYHITNINTTNSQIENPQALDTSSFIDGKNGLNQNGVRPDIQNWIEQQNIQTADKKALLQFANALQSELDTNLQNQSDISKTVLKMSHAMQCLSSKYTNTQSNLPFLVSQVQNYILNTNNRLTNYLSFNNAIGNQLKTVDVNNPNQNACL
jgi:hypothetical protein